MVLGFRVIGFRVERLQDLGLRAQGLSLTPSPGGGVVWWRGVVF